MNSKTRLEIDKMEKKLRKIKVNKKMKQNNISAKRMSTNRIGD